ncbi:MAG: hypothetical protein H7281_00695 [Bacteriovorax sp.]|nr:hypothetical protein [Bacteriovorax sp.]
MKTILLGLIVLVSLNASASEKRTYTKMNSFEARVKIETEEKKSIQAAIYVDGLENAKFIKDMLSDKKSILSKLKSNLEIENCNKNSTPEKPWIDGCGEVTLTSEVRTSFGRGGWMSGGGSYTFFVGFTNDGTGHDFDVSHMVTFSERVEAQTTPDGNYSGVIIKNLYLVKVKKIDDLTP